MVKKKKVAGTLVSRVDYPVPLGSGKSGITLPPRGKAEVEDITGFDKKDSRFVVIEKEKGGS